LISQDSVLEVFTQSDADLTDGLANALDGTMLQRQQQIVFQNYRGALGNSDPAAAPRTGRLGAPRPVAVIPNSSTAKATNTAMRAFEEYLDARNIDQPDGWLSSHAIKHMAMHCCCVSLLSGLAALLCKQKPTVVHDWPVQHPIPDSNTSKFARNALGTTCPACISQLLLAGHCSAHLHPVLPVLAKPTFVLLPLHAVG
jgi:hypothetical protein